MNNAGSQQAVPHTLVTNVATPPANSASDNTRQNAPTKVQSDSQPATESENKPGHSENSDDTHSHTPTMPVLDVNPSAQISLLPEIDREAVIKYINEQGFLTYQVRITRVNSYLKSLLSLAGILTQNLIYQGANDEVKNEVTDLMT